MIMRRHRVQKPVGMSTHHVSNWANFKATGYVSPRNISPAKYFSKGARQELVDVEQRLQLPKYGARVMEEKVLHSHHKEGWS